MEFSNRTKLVLVDSMKELMAATPLDKITVKAIVDNCGTTRQTFYRNFKDRYDLVNWYFDRIVQKTIRQMGISLTLREGLMRKFEYMIEDKQFISSALSSSDYNNLMNYDYHCILEFYEEVAKANGEVTEEIEFLVRFYCHGSMDMVGEWVKSGMKKSPEEMAQILIDAMPTKLIPYFTVLNGK